jgi:subfamily B ATP-binding cassette protein MsbA
MSMLSMLWRYTRPYVGWVVISIFAITIYASATAALVSLVRPIFGEVLQSSTIPAPVAMMSGEGGGKTSSPTTSKPASQGGRWTKKVNPERLLRDGYESLKRRWGIGPDQVVWFVPLLFILIFLVRAGANFVSGYSFQHIGLGATTRMRNDLYASILGQSTEFFARHPSGELVSRVVNDVAIMQNAISNGLFDLIQQASTLLLLVALLLSIDAPLAAICLVVAPVLVLPIVRFGKGMRRTSHRSQERMADLANLVNEGVRGHRVVKAFGMEGFELQRFRGATRRHLRVNLWAAMLSNLSSPVVESLSVVGAAGLIMYAGIQIRGGRLSAPLFVMFLVNLLVMYDPIRKLNKVNLMLQQSLAAAHRVAGVMTEPVAIEERPGARPIETVRNGVEFRGVSFGYEEMPVLKGIELRIQPGEIVALVGPSGAGKSTLVNLLPRFFDPDDGAVLIDGVDLRDLKLSSLRSLIGIVTQETVLFNDTVRNNIAYGRADLPIEQVRAAATAAFADAFIEALPSGYDTVVGESGARLSGGERQRLAIARALLKDAPILILDEATSQLDAESESLVQKALYNLMEGRTTLVIAHRLSTVSKADRIIVLERGRIVEQGGHGELLAAGGLYRRLYDLQFRG